MAMAIKEEGTRDGAAPRGRDACARPGPGAAGQAARDGRSGPSATSPRSGGLACPVTAAAGPSLLPRGVNATGDPGDAPCPGLSLTTAAGNGTRTSRLRVPDAPAAASTFLSFPGAVRPQDREKKLRNRENAPVGDHNCYDR